MKRSIIACLMLCLIAPIEAQKKPFGNGLYWELNNGVLTISGNGAMDDLGIQTPWFDIDSNINKIVIEHGVTSIGRSAFRLLPNLQSVVIANTVTRIGDDSFRDCSKLQSVSIPTSMESIGSCAFTLCKSLQSIEVPYSVKQIGENAFSGCNNNNFEILRPIKSLNQSQYYIVWKYYGKHGLKCNDGTWSIPLVYDEITPLTGDYLKIMEKGRYGMVTLDGKVIIPCEMEALEAAGTGYLRYKLNGFWGLMNYTGKIIIDTNRGYTSIGDFKSFNKRFSYTMAGYKGECDAMGRQISKIKVETPQQQVVVKKEETPKKQEEKKTQEIIIKHDPVPVQQWQDCWACRGSGKMGCDNCGGSGTKYIGDRLHRCSRCNMSGEIPCNICYGSKGQYITVYK